MILFIPIHLFTFKTPINSAFMSDKGNCYHALEKCEGVKKWHSHPLYHLFFLTLILLPFFLPSFGSYDLSSSSESISFDNSQNSFEPNLKSP